MVAEVRTMSENRVEFEDFRTDLDPTVLALLRTYIRRTVDLDLVMLLTVNKEGNLCVIPRGDVIMNETAAALLYRAVCAMGQDVSRLRNFGRGGSGDG
jgi:hypothetical protein